MHEKCTHMYFGVTDQGENIKFHVTQFFDIHLHILDAAALFYNNYIIE